MKVTVRSYHYNERLELVRIPDREIEVDCQKVRASVIEAPNPGDILLDTMCRIKAGEG